MREFRLDVTETTPEFDVCVIGGGMAGYCAALAAAREGARTVIIQDRPVFGGCGSTEMRVPFSGAGSHNPAANETGIILELLTEERAHSPHSPGYGMVNAGWDLLLYDKARREPNLTTLLNTHARNVVMDGNAISAVIAVQLGTEKVWEVRARVFIEATGDGAIGAAAGVPFRIGQEVRSEYGESMAPDEPWDWTLGSSLVFRARDEGRPVDFVPPEWAVVYPDEESLSHRGHGQFEGGYWWIEVGFPHETIRDNEEIRDELLAHLYGVWDHIKNRCTHRQTAANWALDWVGMLPAKRESRRFIGAHVLTQTQIAERELFPDRVAYGGWIIDDHTKGGIVHRDQKPSFDGTEETHFLVAPYSVPLRSLYAANVSNLLFAGRVMSASRLAFNSLRVQRTLAVVGQAAGSAAALCSQKGCTPAEFAGGDIHTLQQSLLRQDCYIPRVRNEDSADVARQARVTASSTFSLVAQPAEDGVSLTEGAAQVLPLSEWPQQFRVYLRNTGDSGVALSATLHRADDIWDLGALDSEPCAALEFILPAGYTGPVVADAGDADLGLGLYWLKVEAAEGVLWLMQTEPLPGLTAARREQGRWVHSPSTFSSWRPLAADVLPESRCYEPGNIINGVGRPEQWTNVWLSEGDAPQCVRLELPAPVELDRIQIAWGLNFNRSYFQMPALMRAPECARDYRIEVETSCHGRQVWAEVSGNYQRLRIHERPADFAGAIREVIITVEVTNGAPRVEIDEIRAHAVS